VHCASAAVGGDVEQPWLMNKYAVIHKPEYMAYHYAASAGPSHGHRKHAHKKFGKDRTYSSEDMIADRQTNTHTQTLSSQYSASLSGRSNNIITRLRRSSSDHSTDAARSTPLRSGAGGRYRLFVSLTKILVVLHINHFIIFS